MQKIALIANESTFKDSFLAALDEIVPTQKVMTATSLSDFLQRVPKRSKMDHIFVDVDQFNDEELNTLKTLSKKFACAEVIAIVSKGTPEQTLACLRAGASGYLHRDSLEFLALCFDPSVNQQTVGLKDWLRSFFDNVAFVFPRIWKKSTLVAR